MQSEAEQKRVLVDAGIESERFSENHEAYHLYMAAREYNRALGIINTQVIQNSMSNGCHD